MAGRRHHFIPRMILRNFADDRGQLWFWRREFPRGVVKRAAAENLFVETDLYSIVREDGSVDAGLEDELAAMESVGADFMRQLLGIVRRGQVPRLDEGSWDFWRRFIYVHMKRSPAYLERVAARLGTWESVTEKLATVASEGGPDGDRATALLSDPAALRKYVNNLRPLVAGRAPSDDVEAALKNRGISVFRAPPRKSFIVGEIGFARAKVTSKHAVTGSLTFVPIAPDVALGFSVQPDQVGVGVIEALDLRLMNEAMAAQSRLIASSSERLLRSLSKAVSYQA